MEKFFSSRALKPTTRYEYEKTFKRIMQEFNTDDLVKLLRENYGDVFHYIESQNYKTHNVIVQVNNLCKFYDIETQDIRETDTRKKEIRKWDVQDFQKKVSMINYDMKAKVFLSLLLNDADFAVRRDLALTRIKHNIPNPEGVPSYYDKDTGTFVFNELRKTQRRLEFTIPEDLKELVNKYISTIKDSKYLFIYGQKGPIESDFNRLTAYSRYIEMISKIYLGKKMTSNSFRQCAVQASTDRIMNSDKSNSDKVRDLIESAKMKDHSIATEVSNYLDNVEESKPKEQEACPKEDTSDIDKAILLLVRSGYTVTGPS